MLDWIEQNIFFIVLSGFMLILLILYISNSIKLSKLRKSYKEFMKRLGKEENIVDNLNVYMDRVNKVEKDNIEIATFCKQLDENRKKCIQKIGIVRYNAFENVGSDLSFSLAVLDEENNGYVLNSIYARENSNIYAKPIINGKSTYVLSKEEQEAIEKAIQNVSKQP